MNKFVCLYKSGGPYTEKEVFNLYNQVQHFLPVVEQFIVYTDEPEKFKGTNIIAKQLESNLPGKWSMHELFKEKGHVMVTGLDTLFVKDVSWLFDIDIPQNTFYGIKAFRDSASWANGVMMWNGDWERLFYGYSNPPAYRLEQKWTYDKLIKEKADIRYLNSEGLNVKSYKHHCTNRIPDGTEIVVFHGHPRPQECTNYIKNLYQKWNHQS